MASACFVMFIILLLVKRLRIIVATATRFGRWRGR